MNAAIAAASSTPIHPEHEITDLTARLIEAIVVDLNCSAADAASFLASVFTEAASIKLTVH